MITYSEKETLKQIKEELVILRLQTKVLTEAEFKKKLDKTLKLIESLLSPP